jgi:hypothetical protein
MAKLNQYAEAFKENFNILGLAAVGAISAATLNPLPLLAGIVVEAAYLLFVPDSGWYTRRLARRHDAAVEARRQKLKETILPNLRESMQQRYWRLQETRAQMDSAHLGSEEWFLEVRRKLDYLLEKFLHFAQKESEYRTHLQSVLEQVRDETRDKSVKVRDKRQRQAEPESALPSEEISSSDPWVRHAIEEVQHHYLKEVATLKGFAESEQDPNTKAILEKRLDVLQRRADFVGKIAKILTNLEHQLALLEDTFGLINDQIKTQSPEQVLSEVDDVVYQTDSMTKVLEELAPYEQMIARLGA